jgi:hypothetical protein
VRRTGCAGERAGGYRGGEGATGRGVRSQRCGSGSSFSSSRKRHERDGNVEAGLSVRTRSAGFGAATHLLRRWPLRLSRAATCARAVSDWPRARRRARLVAIFQRFELEGELRLIFFDRANSRRHPQSWLSARRDSCLFGEFLSLRRLRLSFAPSVKEPGAMASTENMPPLPEAIAALKDEGNGFFRAGDFLKAAGAYTKALKVRPVARPVSRFRITRTDDLRTRAARRFDRADLLPRPRPRFPTLRRPARTPRPGPSWRRFTATAARRS